MGCCGSNRASSIGGLGSSDPSGVAVGLPDGPLSPIHSSWLDPSADVDLALLPPEITRKIVDGAVKISIVLDQNNTITINSAEKVLRTIRRQHLWEAFPILSEGILKPVALLPGPKLVEPIGP
jgi:hypothetical protein